MTDTSTAMATGDSVSQGQDLTGLRFGKLSVISVAESKNGRRWNVLCDCGIKKIVYESRLRRGTSKSCGCRRREKEDLTGLAFGTRKVHGEAGRSKGGDVLWRCRCSCGAESLVTGGDLKRGKGCTVCAGTARVPDGVAEAEMRAAGFTPIHPYPGTTRSPWPSLCNSCETEVSPSLQGIRGGKSCRTCAYRGQGKRIPHDEAALDMRAAGFEPLEVYPGAAAPWRSRCMQCHKVSTPRLSGVRQGYRCIHCARCAPIPPEQAKDWIIESGFEPLEPYPGAGKPWLCRCMTCGSRVRPRLSGARSGRACLVCSYGDRGVRPGEPAILYVIHHAEYNALKVGIAKANPGNMRLKTHSRTGWTTLHVEQFSTGSRAYAVEQQVLAHLRYDLGFLPAVPAMAMRYGGWTETVSCDDISSTTLIAIVAEACQHES